MWDVADSMRKLLSSLHSSFSIGGKNAEDWLQENVDNFGHLPKIQALQLPAIRQKIVDSRQKLLDYCAGLDSLVFPLNFGADKAKYMTLVQRYEDGWDQCQRVKQSLLQTAHDQAASGAKQKQDWLNGRDKLRNSLSGKGVPPAMSKNMADTLFALVKNPAQVGIALDYQRLECSLNVDSSRADLLNPFLVRALPSDAPQTDDGELYFEKLFAGFVKDNAAAVRSKVKECEAILKVPGSAMTCTFGSIPVATELALNPPYNERLGEEEQWFQHVRGLRHLIYTSYTEVCDISLGAWPWKHLACWCTQHIGRSVAVLVDMKTAATIHHTGKWLEALKTDDLSTFPTWFMEEGSTLWCPFGSVPIFVGVSPKS